jgi:hypothetical protein
MMIRFASDEGLYTSHLSKVQLSDELRLWNNFNALWLKAKKRPTMSTIHQTVNQEPN